MIKNVLIYFLLSIFIIVEPLTLSTPTHKPRQPRSVSAYGGRRRPSGSQSVNDFQQLSSEFLTEKLKSSEGNLTDSFICHEQII